MKVNTLIIGAGRSGTTSICAYLSHHPEVNFSITKEVHYFSLEDLYKRGEKYFHSLFEGSAKKINATADTYLLIDKKAPGRVKSYNPDMKIIIMLREPVARAFSNFNYSVNFGHEEANISFLKTIQLEKERLTETDIVIKNNLCNCYGSLYYKHISYWSQFFPEENMLIFKLDDLKNNPVEFYKNLSQQLEIDYIPFEEAKTKFNARSGVKSKWLQQLLLNRKNGFRKVLSFFLRPFRKIIIKSGIIDKVYKANKREIAQTQITDEERQMAKQYFVEDLQLLKLNYGISFEI